MKKRFLCLSLAFLLSGSQVMTVSASREQELREQQAYTSYALNDTYYRINELENQKAALRAQISELDTNLMNIMVSVAVLEDSISQKEADITKTTEDLAKAEKARDKQYEDMKKRIQLIYEKGGDSAWFQMMMEAEDLSELLNRAEYTQKLYKHDRECLDKYVQVVEQVTNLGNQYRTEKAELEAMHNEYTLQQQQLEVQINDLEAVSANYEAEIAYAQEQAYQYAALLEQQTAEIAQLEAERIAAEQAAAAAAAQAAAEQAAAEQAYQEQLMQQQMMQEQASQEQVLAASDDTAYAQGSVQYDEYGNVVDNSGNNTYTYDASADAAYTDDTYTAYTDDTYTDSTYTDSTYTDNIYTDSTYTDSTYTDSTYTDNTYTDTTQYDAYGNVIVDSSSVTTDTTAVNTSSTSSGSGSSVVDYATQFVGNPYVWGGTSLTNGADCSGFVQSVYSNFGVDLPRTSYDQMNVGTEVSYSDAQAGDLICYGGHVAIYMGDGKIVHAANSEQGIIVSDNAAYDTILSVRRLV